MTTTTTQDADLMTASLAGRIRMEFVALMGRDACIGDVEFRQADQAADQPPAAGGDQAPPAALPVGKLAGQTPAARRQAARRATIRPVARAQALTADDLL